MATAGKGIDPQLTKKKRYTKKVKEINYVLQEDVIIRREGNSILLPYFSFDKSKRTDYAEYKIQFGKRDGVMEVHSSSGLGIPTEFDYKVFIGIMRIYEQQGGMGDTVSFLLNDIIKQIGISKGGRNYKLIRDSILRLQRTNYVMKHIFIEKMPSNQEKFNKIAEDTGLIEPFAGFSGNLKNITVSVDDTNNTIVKREEEMSIFVHRISEDKYTEGGDHISSMHTLEFSRHIMNNLKNDYFRKYSSTKLLSLERGILMRLFEITDYQRGKRLRHTYIYTTLIMMIPLNANNGLKKNIKYILSYIDELVSRGYIESYEAGSDRVSISFFPNRTGGYLKEGTSEKEGDDDQKGHPKSFELTESDEVIRDAVDKFLTEQKRVNIGIDGVMIIILEELDKKTKDIEMIKSNLEYAIRNSKQNSMGFFRKALRGDWAKDSRKLKESRDKQIQIVIEEGVDVEDSTKSLFDRRQEKQDIFNQYIASFNDEQMNECYIKYNISKKHSIAARNNDLRLKLFQDGTLKV